MSWLSNAKEQIQSVGQFTVLMMHSGKALIRILAMFLLIFKKYVSCKINNR